jgi:hypothetical protein
MLNMPVRVFHILLLVDTILLRFLTQTSNLFNEKNI